MDVPRLLMGGDVFGDIHITKIEMGLTRSPLSRLPLVECRRYGFGGRVHGVANSNPTQNFCCPEAVN